MQLCGPDLIKDELSCRAQRCAGFNYPVLGCCDTLIFCSQTLLLCKNDVFQALTRLLTGLFKLTVLCFFGEGDCIANV